jgi:hypothetical protein
MNLRKDGDQNSSKRIRPPHQKAEIIALSFALSDLARQAELEPLTRTLSHALNIRISTNVAATLIGPNFKEDWVMV